MKRMWINQPSSLDAHHSDHGKRVLVDDKDFVFENSVKTYFVDGDVVSSQVNRNALSDGWPKRKDTGSALNETQLDNRVDGMDEKTAKDCLRQLVGLMFIDYNGQVDVYKEWDQGHQKVMRKVGKTVIGRL